MNKTYCFFFTRSINQQEPEAFISAVCNHLPATIPSQFAARDDEQLPFNTANRPAFVARWWSGLLYWWAGRRDAIDRPSYGSAFLGNVHEDTLFLHVFQTELAPEAACVGLLTDLSLQLCVDYAYIHVLPELSQRLPGDDLLAGATPKKLRRCLPGVPWAACYGSLYLDFFGKDALLTLPIHRSEQFSPDLIYCQLTPRLLDCLDNVPLVAKIQQDVRVHLGEDAFFSPHDPNRVVRAPEFKKPVVRRPDNAT
jgi:hypothetical protein